jgi:hypothetical protein
MRASRKAFESTKACANATVEASAPVRLSPTLGRPAQRHPGAARTQSGRAEIGRDPGHLAARVRVPYHASLRRSALLVELEHLLVTQFRRPAVRLGHRGIQIAVRIVEPRGALVVEIGQRPLLEDGGGLALPPPRSGSII